MKNYIKKEVVKMNDVNIGQIIKELRLFRNIDEARFAERCKVDVSVVEGWEKIQVRSSN